MNLDYNDQPFEFVSRMRKIQQSVSQLNMNVGDVIQYFFLNGLQWFVQDSASANN